MTVTSETFQAFGQRASAVPTADVPLAEALAPFGIADQTTVRIPSVAIEANTHILPIPDPGILRAIREFASREAAYRITRRRTRGVEREAVERARMDSLMQLVKIAGQEYAFRVIPAVLDLIQSLEQSQVRS